MSIAIAGRRKIIKLNIKKEQNGYVNFFVTKDLLDS